MLTLFLSLMTSAAQSQSPTECKSLARGQLLQCSQMLKCLRCTSILIEAKFFQRGGGQSGDEECGQPFQSNPVENTSLVYAGLMLAQPLLPSKRLRWQSSNTQPTSLSLNHNSFIGLHPLLLTVNCDLQ